MIRVSKYRAGRNPMFDKRPKCDGCVRLATTHIVADSMSEAFCGRATLDLCDRCSDTVYRRLDALRT